MILKKPVRITALEAGYFSRFHFDGWNCIEGAQVEAVCVRRPERARKIVGDVELSHLTTDLKPGVDMAAEALTRGHSPNKELYLFSDMQRTGWDRQAAALKEKLKEISEKATVYLVRCGAGTPRNVTLAGIASESGIPHTGEHSAILL